jgi:hypothetical protein
MEYEHLYHHNSNHYKILVTSSVQVHSTNNWSSQGSSNNYHPAVAISTEVIEFADVDSAIAAADAINNNSNTGINITQTAKCLFDDKHYRDTKEARHNRMKQSFGVMS